ncbi:MAG: ribbon-helix-helix protein, CopG family [Bifidobacteriaceae bacterium]|jgi:predicted transcriptional regulator|nr:ribbon-helix-helix protein, CopG family [Bifidobacteriaceae bacterium]
MAVLERRLQVLIDPERGEQLERLAKAQGKSVAAVVRDAVDDLLARDAAVKQAALERLLKRAEAPELSPSEDWPLIKAHIEEDIHRGFSA